MSARTHLLLLPFLFACHTTTAPETRVPLDLEDLVAVYQEQSGVNVTYDDATRDRLASIPVRHIDEADTIVIGPAAQLQPKVELQFAILPMTHANAGDMSRLLEELLRDVAQRARGRGEARPQVLADERTNSLLVNAPAEDMDRIKAMVAALDVAPPGER